MSPCSTFCPWYIVVEGTPGERRRIHSSIQRVADVETIRGGVAVYLVCIKIGFTLSHYFVHASLFTSGEIRYLHGGICNIW